MKLNFLSPAYFICIGAELLFIAGCFFLLRKRRPAIQKLALLILMLLNIGQHLAKSIVWPHLWGTGFSLINTAYNVCAFLILLSPFALLSKSQGLKDFMTYVGTCGPLLAITVPYWFTGQDLLQWEVARFYVCHDLLIATSVLPALLGLHRPSYKSFWKIPLLFFLMLILILFNDAVCVVPLSRRGSAGRRRRWNSSRPRCSSERTGGRIRRSFGTPSPCICSWRRSGSSSAYCLTSSGCGPT